MTSRIPGFYRLRPHGRLDALQDRGVVGRVERAIYESGGLALDNADLMIENVVSTFALPNAMAVNFLIDARSYVVPMVVEEASVVAAVSHMAKLARSAGGFRSQADPSVMIGQIQLRSVEDPGGAAARLRAGLPELERRARAVHPRLEQYGGGFRGFKIRNLTYDEPGRRAEHMVVLHVLLDCADAMGANMVNTLCERLAPHVARLTGEQVGLRILSNLADTRLARAEVALRVHLLDDRSLPGAEVAERIAAAWRFAWADPYRAATHNKGVMNGIDALAIATGNDWRAVEAGLHAFCCRDGQYRPLTRWEVREGVLHGSFEGPLQLGIVGGPIKIHPTARANLQALGVTSAAELSRVAAAVGLAQNLGALRALATDGIQLGHMRLHARNVAGQAGARGAEVAAVSNRLVVDQDFSLEHAALVLRDHRQAAHAAAG